MDGEMPRMHNRCSSMTENKQRNSWINQQTSQRFSSQSASFAASGFGTNKTISAPVINHGSTLVRVESPPDGPSTHRAKTEPTAIKDTRKNKSIPIDRTHGTIDFAAFTSAARPPCPQPSRHLRHHLLKKNEKVERKRLFGELQN